MAYLREENGSLKRTVRCGYCYDIGHNKGSCTKRKKHLKEAVTAYEKDKSTINSPWPYDDAVRELYKMNNKGKNRSCGFCRKKGHTRRTCTDREQKVVEAMEKTLFFRKRLCEKFIAAGFGPGTLVNLDLRELETEPFDSPREKYSGRLAVVTSIEFENIYPYHKYNGRSWYYSLPRVIHVQMIKPFLSRYGDVYLDMIVNPSIELLNTDDMAVHKSLRRERHGTQSIASPVLCSHDMMSKDSVDPEIIKKQVLKNIVDPR